MQSYLSSTVPPHAHGSVMRALTDAAVLQTFEDSHPFSGKGMTEEDQKSRRDLVNLLINLARQLGLVEQTVHDSVLLLDRLIRRGLGIRNLTSGVLLAAVALIAAQQGLSLLKPCNLLNLSGPHFE